MSHKILLVILVQFGWVNFEISTWIRKYSSTMPTPALGSRSSGTVCIYVVGPLFRGMGPTKTRSKLVLGVNTTTMRFISTTKTLKIHKADTLPAKFSTETTGPAGQGPRSSGNARPWSLDFRLDFLQVLAAGLGPFGVCIAYETFTLCLLLALCTYSCRRSGE